MSGYIITADWHLRKDRPRARRDEDWLATQEKILAFIAMETNKRDAELLIGGDLFERSFVPDIVKNIFLDFAAGIKNKVYLLAGNHDLLYHNIDNLKSSSIGVVMNGKNIYHLKEAMSSADFGGDITDNGDTVFIHQLTFETKHDMPPDVNAKAAQELLDEYPRARIIFTGDNHKSFLYVSGYDERIVLNPGCIIRQKASEIEYNPGMWYVPAFDADINEFEFIEIPDDPDMITRDHLIEKEQKLSHITAFIETVKDSGAISLDFVENAREKMKVSTEINEDVKQIIKELLEA